MKFLEFWQYIHGCVYRTDSDWWQGGSWIRLSYVNALKPIIGRFKIPESITFDDSARYSAVPQHPQDFKLNPSCSAGVHFHLCMAHSCWDNSSGEYFRKYES